MEEPLPRARSVRQRVAELIRVPVGAIVAVTLVSCGSSSDQKSASKGERTRPRAAPLATCVSLWNRADNARQRALLNNAALVGPSVRSTTPGKPPLSERVLVLRYAGPPLEDVGVGEHGVNASRGDCLVAHPSNTLFLYAGGAWHKVGYSPGLAFNGIPQRATRSPNGVVTLRRPGQHSVDSGRIALIGKAAGPS
jgi:hypothetical protein